MVVPRQPLALDLRVPWTPRGELVVPEFDGPWAFMRWIARQQWRTLLGGAAFGVLWMLCQALMPYALGRAIDAGIAFEGGEQPLDASAPALWPWLLALLGLAAAQAVFGTLRHRQAVWNWVQAALGASRVVGHHVSRTGVAMPRKLATGEVVSTVASDAIRLGDVYDVTARFIGSIVAYGVVTALLLSSSVTLGVVVAVGVPVLVSMLALVVRPLQRAQAAQREASGALTTLGADTVAGLRVLRGVGGERVFLRRYTERSQQVRKAGVRVAGVQAGLDALQVLLPGGFIVLVTWLGARAAVSGSITAGELVAFYGYAAFLVQPVRTATEVLQKFTRGHVASVRVLAVLAVEPAVSDPVDPAASPGPRPPLDDPTTGIRVEPGTLTALVSARPADTAAAAERMARLTDRPSGEKGLPSARLGGVPVDQLTAGEVRRRVVLADSDPRLFTGWVRSQLDPSGRHDDAALMAALHTAAAHDVLDGLPRGLDDEVDERGRSLSGGQRQRISLARALLTDAETLVLVEPTSAVDAHTEAVIADRLAAARAGRTTVVVTASPLLLDRADTVVFLGPDGDAPATGTHHELLRRGDAVGAAYRDTVTRGEDA